MQTLTIFVSSPGDVFGERVAVGRVVEKLQAEFWSFVRLELILWERKALRATAHFQEELIRPSDCDIVIGILWHRLGTPLPGQFRKCDGSRFDSGTEWELVEAFEGYGASVQELGRGQGKPDILVYRRCDPRPRNADPALEALEAEQEKRAAAFFRSYFQNPDGTNARAFSPYMGVGEFERNLTDHLSDLILKRIPTLKQGFEPPPISGNPFLDLKHFDFRHCDRFFGRNRAIREGLDRLKRLHAKGSPFLLVYGASGYGKSSLMRAGIAPRLTAPGYLNGVSEWRRLMLLPSRGTGSLIERFVRALLRPTGGEEGEPPEAPRFGLPEFAGTESSASEADAYDTASLTRLLSHGEGMLFGLADLVTALDDLSPGAALLLQIDQFEEVFTGKAISDADRTSFFRMIAGLTATGRVWVVATMRSEFFPEIAKYEDLRALVQLGGGYILRAPDDKELSEIIRYPALAARLLFENHPTEAQRDLSDSIFEAARNQPDALPLLEFTLSQLYGRLDREAGDRVLKFRDYEELSGLEGAIATLASEAYEELSPHQQDAHPQLFAKLVQVLAGSRGEASKRRPSLRAVSESHPGAPAFIASFKGSSLLVTDRDPSTGEATVTLAHEALLKHWPLLARWIDEHRADLQAESRLRDETKRWAELRQKSGKKAAKRLLLAEARLAEAQRVADSGLFDLSGEPSEYLQASRSRAAFKQRVLQGVIVLFAGLAVLAGFLAVKSQQEAENALLQTRKAREEEGKAWLERAESYVAESGMGFHAGMMALRSLGYTGYATAEEASNSENSSSGSNEGTSGDSGDPMALSRKTYPPLLDGNQALKRRAERIVMECGADPLPIWRGGINREEESQTPWFSADGKRLVSKSWKLDLTTGRVELGGDRSMDLTGSDAGGCRPGLADAVFRQWEENPAPPGDKPLSWSCSPDGRRLIVGYADRTVREWEGEEEQDTILEPEAIGEPYETQGGNQHQASEGILYNEVGFSPSGHLIVSGRITGAIVLMEAHSGEMQAILTANGSPVTSLAFRPDSRLLASGHINGEVQIWDVTNPSAPPETFDSCSPGIDSLAFAPDGKTLLVVGSDQVVSLWSLTGLIQTSRRTMGEALGVVHEFWIHQKKGFLIEEDSEKAYHHINVWDLNGEFRQGSITYPGEEVSCVPHLDPSVIRAALDDYARRKSPPIPDQAARVIEQRNRPDDLPGINLVDAESDVVLRVLEGVQRVFFEDAESFMATVESDRVVTIWERPLGEKLYSFTLEASGLVTAWGFDAGSGMMACGTERGEVHLWDHRLRRQLARLDSGEVFEILTLGFTPEGDRLIAGSSSGGIYAWDLSPQAANVTRYLTEGWVTLEGRSVRWGDTVAPGAGAHCSEFLNIAPAGHLGILRSGLSEEEIGEKLFWSYLRARNWRAALAIYRCLSRKGVRYSSMGSLIQWLRSDLARGAVSAGLAEVHANGLRSILQDEPEDIRKLWEDLLMAGALHLVAPDETYESIAMALGVDPGELLQLNEGKPLRAGLELRLPSFKVVVIKGEFEVSTLALEHGTTVEKLAALNGWTMEGYLSPAQVLVPLQDLKAGAVGVNPDAVYKVEDGDSYGRIARLFGLPEELLRQLNQDEPLEIGMRIRVAGRPRGDGAPAVPRLTATGTFVVEEEINMGDLARKFGTTVEILNELNGWDFSPTLLIAAGSELCIPTPRPDDD